MQGKGSHLKVFLNGKQSTLPMHGMKQKRPEKSGRLGMLAEWTTARQ